jgi:hypothetical protein
LGESFTEEEVLYVIEQMPGDNAPGPDGSTGLFFKKCWKIIISDIMRVFNLFGNLHASNLHGLNSANVVLLPKKEGGRDLGL